MKTVSDDYRQAIYANTRQSGVSIVFPFIDPYAKDAVLVQNIPPAAQIGQQGEMFNNNYEMVGKVAQFEPEHWKLDGSFVLPLPTGQTEGQYGFWAQPLSDEDGRWPGGLGFRFWFTQPVTIPGLTLLFDDKTENYAVDFDYTAYDEHLNILRHEEIRGNNVSRCVVDKGVVALKALDLVFWRSNRPRRRLRIAEIDFGIVLTFEGSNLFSASLVSEVDPLAETMPENELNFSALNDGKFDYTHPESYAKYLQRRQQFSYRHWLVLPNGQQEAVNMGDYALQSWKVSDSKVEIKATLNFSALEEHPFRRGSLTQRLNAGQFIQRIFEDYGWTNYEIEDYLYESPTMLPYTGEVTGREALRMVAQLAGAVVLKMPGGKIVVKRMGFEAPHIVDAITYNNAFTPTRASSSQYYNAIHMGVTALSPKETPKGNPIASFTGQPAAPGQAEEFVVPYNYVLCDDAPVLSCTGGEIVAQTLYANYAFVTVVAQGQFTLTLQGQTADFSTGTELVYYAPWHQQGEEVHPYKLLLPMIMQGEQDGALRDWCAEQRFRVLSYRLKTENNWRQNPALDVGDYVHVQMDKNDAREPVMAVKHTLNYNGGALKGVTVGVGRGQIITNNG